MAKKGPAGSSKKSAKKMSGESMIISKSRTKAAARRCNVSSDFYGALDKKVRDIIRDAEQRALDNKRKTLRPYDI
jgi:hypothetical protein